MVKRNEQHTGRTLVQYGRKYTLLTSAPSVRLPPMWMKLKFLLLCLCLSMPLLAQTTQSPPTLDVDKLARDIAGDGGSFEKTQRLVTWINTQFAWTATDYQTRTAEQIIERRGGNCAELSKVLVRLLGPAGVQYRWVAEINIHPYTPRRQETAARMVAEKGNRASVFGLRHNDHRWLEIYDDTSKQWVPADPSVGVVGVRPWIAYRMALNDRPKPAVPEIAETVQDMIVPFAVVLLNNDRTATVENRSEHYLIEEFNRTYGGKLETLPSWKAWQDGVRMLSVRAADAFQGKVNLHESNDDIAHLATVYENLRQEARKAHFQLLSQD